MKQHGFTLLEVLIALTIMASSIVVVATAWSGNFGRINKTQVILNVTQLLQRKMAEMEAKYHKSSPGEISNEEGDFGSEFPEYRWTFEAQKFEMPDLTPIIMQQSGSTTDSMITIMSQMQTSISKAIMEGRVTVYVNTGKSELKYSVTNYFVDFNGPISLSGGQ